MSTSRQRHYNHRYNWRPRFLAALAQTGLVETAAQQAQISARTAYRARDLKNRTGTNLLHAQHFAQAWDDALDQFAATVELEIQQRALHGLERQKPIYYKGEQVGTQVVRVYSDRLLMFLAKAVRPERYGPHLNSPAQYRLANQPPDTSLLDEARERTKQRWANLLPQIRKFFTPQSTSDSDPAQPATQPNANP
jgi:hypothetical protein